MRFLLTLQFDFEADDHPAGREGARIILDAIDIEFIKMLPEFWQLKFQQLREYGPPKPISLSTSAPDPIGEKKQALLSSFNEKIDDINEEDRFLIDAELLGRRGLR